MGTLPETGGLPVKQTANLPTAAEAFGSGGTAPDILRHDKDGDGWSKGPTADETEAVALGTETLIQYDTLLLGWQNWKGGVLQDEKLVLVSKGGRIPEDDELPPGTKPAAKVNVVIEGDQQAIYAATAKGGLNALRRGYNAWRAYVINNPGAHAVVQLGTRPYNHPEFGVVYNPILKLVAYIHADGSRHPVGGDVIRPAAQRLPAKGANQSGTGDEIAF
jgi:hypothetical protein